MSEFSFVVVCAAVVVIVVLQENNVELYLQLCGVRDFFILKSVGRSTVPLYILLVVS